MLDFADAYALWEREQYRVYEQKCDGSFYEIDEEEDTEYWQNKFEEYRLKQAEGDF